MDLELEAKVKEDYEAARENILEAERCEGKSPEAEELIKKAHQKFKELEEAVLAYEESKTKADLMKALNISRELRLLSIDALEKAKEINLRMGWKVIVTLAIATGVAAVLYISSYRSISHWTIHAAFWSFFGVMTNLIYSASKHVMDRDFNRLHVSWYLSKSIQAPFIALALLFLLVSINFGIGGGVSMNFSEMIPAREEGMQTPAYALYGIAFILGLFSRRTWEYLELFKDKLLPRLEKEG
ncbi:hypothetical protein [Candidatus Pyrohabitans sp.]